MEDYLRYELYALFGSWAWWTLVLIMFIRPVHDLFGNRLTALVLRRRKELGNLCGILALLHVVLFFLFITPIDFFWEFSYDGSLDNMFTWGTLAFAMMLPLFLTSNKFAMRLLNKYWKPLQRLAYTMFVFVALHIYFIKGEIAPLIILAVWIGLCGAAWWKKQTRKVKRIKT